MGRTILAVAVALFVLSAVGMAQAEDTVLRGKVVSVAADAGKLVVKPATGDNVTVTTDANTKVKVDGKEAKLADVKAEMTVEVAPATGTATRISARSAKPAVTPALNGTVVSVDVANNTLVVKPKEGANVTVTTDADTKFRVDGKEGCKLSDVKANMLVEIRPITGVAKVVAARTPKISG